MLLQLLAGRKQVATYKCSSQVQMCTENLHRGAQTYGARANAGDDGVGGAHARRREDPVLPHGGSPSSAAWAWAATWRLAALEFGLLRPNASACPRDVQLGAACCGAPRWQ
jgi:hypothetical protein